MLWSEVRKDYPNMWVVVEAMKSHKEGNEKTIEEVSVVNSFKESGEAWQNYQQIHQQEPHRNYLFASTKNEELKIKVQYWAGVRGNT
jgi:predicted helicase